MKVLLDELLPKLFPGLVFQCVPHEGKSDLDKSFPRKLKAWQEPGARFVLMRDNDNADCIGLKAKLVSQCTQSGKPDTLIRLVCQELESWYIGDLAALARAFSDNKINSPANRKRYINPDGCQKPSAEVKRLVPNFQKRSGARLMAAELSLDKNQSHSFNVFVSGVIRILGEMGYKNTYALNSVRAHIS